MHCPLPASHSRLPRISFYAKEHRITYINPSADPVRTMPPSPSHPTVQIASAWAGNTLITVPLPTSQMMADSSNEPVTSKFDLGLNATARTGAVWADRIRKGVARVELDEGMGRGLRGWMREVVSSDAVAR